MPTAIVQQLIYMIKTQRGDDPYKVLRFLPLSHLCMPPASLYIEVSMFHMVGHIIASKN
jgi:hypothetical protein